MTTTPEQKASILWRWKQHRTERKLKGDVRAQCQFNWPSLTPKEVKEIMAAYQRREKMTKFPKVKSAGLRGAREVGKQQLKNAERPSSPKRPPKYVIKCELGHRLYTEGFTDPKVARAFIDAVLGDEATRWKSTTTLTAKGGVLVVSTEELEDLMDMKTPKGVTLPDPIPNAITAFLRGKWPAPGVRGASVTGEGDSMKAAKKVIEDIRKKSGDKAVMADGQRKSTAQPPQLRRTVPEGMITLAELCVANKWEPRRVRVALRGAGWKKPEEGWLWPRKSGIEKKLKELMS